MLNVPEWQKSGGHRPTTDSFPHEGTQAEKDAWVAAKPLPKDGAWYGGNQR